MPSVLALLWYTAAYRAGSIHYEHSSSWAGILSSTVAIYFYLYAGSALLFQAVGFMLPPNRYLQLAAALNLSAVLVFLWSLYVPQVRARRPGGGCVRGGTGWDGMGWARPGLGAMCVSWVHRHPPLSRRSATRPAPDRRGCVHGAERVRLCLGAHGIIHLPGS